MQQKVWRYHMKNNVDKNVNSDCKKKAQVNFRNTDYFEIIQSHDG